MLWTSGWDETKGSSACYCSQGLKMTPANRMQGIKKRGGLAAECANICMNTPTGYRTRFATVSSTPPQEWPCITFLYNVKIHFPPFGQKMLSAIIWSISNTTRGRQTGWLSQYQHNPHKLSWFSHVRARRDSSFKYLHRSNKKSSFATYKWATSF